MDKSKLILPISIVIAAIVIGGFFYAVQANKQESIERQQQLELEQKQREAEAKADLEKKEYLAKQKSNCLQIYTTESNKWNNVRGWRYDELIDSCYIRYKESTAKTDEECDKLYPLLTGELKTRSVFFRENALCKEGEFENSF